MKAWWMPVESATSDSGRRRQDRRTACRWEDGEAARLPRVGVNVMQTWQSMRLDVGRSRLKCVFENRSTFRRLTFFFSASHDLDLLEHQSAISQSKFVSKLEDGVGSNANLLHSNLRIGKKAEAKSGWRMSQWHLLDSMNRLQIGKVARYRCGRDSIIDLKVQHYPLMWHLESQFRTFWSFQQLRVNLKKSRCDCKDLGERC